MKQRVNNDDFGELGLTRSNLQKEGWLNNKQKFVLFNCLTGLLFPDITPGEPLGLRSRILKAGCPLVTQPTVSKH